MKCEDCLKYDKCEIIGKLKEINEEYLSEKDGIKQPKITYDFTDIIQNYKERKIALDRSQLRKLKEILGKRDKCFFRRVHMQEQGSQFFRDRSRTSPIILRTKD
jgi:hypothetical protein